MVSIKFEATIIGAGIVGLALAARLAPKLGSELLLVEQHDGFGKETSSRNSEVIHAGIYYPKNSLKARLCVAGRRQIYQLCRDHDIAHQRLGKIIVATSADEEGYLGGRLRFGPDLEYCEEPDYQVDEKSHGKFATAIQRYLPSLDVAKLIPDMAGIRPRLQGPDDTFCDFIIHEESPAGAPGFINLLGIESPGLTAAPAIANEIATRLDL